MTAPSLESYIASICILHCLLVICLPQVCEDLQRVFFHPPIVILNRTKCKINVIVVDFLDYDSST